MERKNGRALGEMRPIHFERGFTKNAPGSVLASFGDTRVLCTATYTDGVPPFLQGKGQGWMTAEYSMLPSSTKGRKSRDRGGRVDGRSVEIQRLIGRSMRGIIDLKKMTERTIWVDCDVLQADGGTRTASVTGGFVAMCLAMLKMREKKQLKNPPLTGMLAAVSVGVVENRPVLDLDYVEDSAADVDDAETIAGYEGMLHVFGHGSDEERAAVFDVVAGLILDDAALASAWIPTWERLDRDQLVIAGRALLGRDDISARVSEIGCPILAVHGGADQAIGIDRARALAEAARDHRGVVEIDGAAHAPNMTNADEVNAALRDFLTSIG